MPHPDLDRLLHNNSAMPADWNGMITVADIRRLVAEVKRLRAHLAERAGGRTPEAGVSRDWGVVGNHLASALIMLVGANFPKADTSPEDALKWFQDRIPEYDVWIGWRACWLWAQSNNAPASPEGRNPTCPTCAEREGQLVAAQEALTSARARLHACEHIVWEDRSFSAGGNALADAACWRCCDEALEIVRAALAAPPRAPQPTSGSHPGDRDDQPRSDA